MNCGFFYKETPNYFADGWLFPGKNAHVVTIGATEREYWETNVGEVNAYAEYSLFSLAASDALMESDKCVFHSAAVCYRDRAYLIAGPPGMGKSTQVRTLRELHPEEFSVISGDRPVLCCEDEHEIMVWPSPWNGKEGWNGANKAPLAGLVLLERGEENSICRVRKKEAVLQVFNSIFQYRETDEQIYRTSRLAAKILSAAPIWKLTSYSIPDSTKLLYTAVFSKEAGDETI